MVANVRSSSRRNTFFFLYFTFFSVVLPPFVLLMSPKFCGPTHHSESLQFPSQPGHSLHKVLLEMPCPITVLQVGKTKWSWGVLDSQPDDLTGNRIKLLYLLLKWKICINDQ